MIILKKKYLLCFLTFLMTSCPQYEENTNESQKSSVTESSVTEEKESNCEDKLASCKDDITQYKKVVDIKNEVSKNLSKEFDNLKKEIDRLTNEQIELKEINKKLIEHKEKNIKLENDKTNLLTKIKTLEYELTQKKSQDKISDDDEDKIRKLQEELHKKNDIFNQNEKKIKDLKSKNENLTLKKDKLEDAVSTLENYIGKWASKAKKLYFENNEKLKEALAHLAILRKAKVIKKLKSIENNQTPFIIVADSQNYIYVSKIEKEIKKEFFVNSPFYIFDNIAQFKKNNKKIDVKESKFSKDYIEDFGLFQLSINIKKTDDNDIKNKYFDKNINNEPEIKKIYIKVVDPKIKECIDKLKGQKNSIIIEVKNKDKNKDKIKDKIKNKIKNQILKEFYNGKENVIKIIIKKIDSSTDIIGKDFKSIGKGKHSIDIVVQKVKGSNKSDVYYQEDINSIPIEVKLTN